MSFPFLSLGNLGHLFAIVAYLGPQVHGPKRTGRGRSGQSTASSPTGEDELFILKLINRPILVLRGLDGFVCHRRGSNQLDTNRSTYDVFHLSFRDGAYQIRGAGKESVGGSGREACCAWALLTSSLAPRPWRWVLVHWEPWKCVQRW